MKQGPNGKNRPRGRNNNNNQMSKGRGPSRNQVYDSNGPGIRVRGNAHQVIEKYQALARDAAAQGDRVLCENYLQHAEHYLRIVLAINQNNPQRAFHLDQNQALLAGGPDDFLEDGDEDFEDEAEVSVSDGAVVAVKGVEEPQGEAVPFVGPVVTLPVSQSSGESGGTADMVEDGGPENEEGEGFARGRRRRSRSAGHVREDARSEGGEVSSEGSAAEQVSESEPELPLSKPRVKISRSSSRPLQEDLPEMASEAALVPKSRRRRVPKASTEEEAEAVSPATVDQGNV